MKKFDVLINGYYGFDNLGDEAVLSSIVTSLREANSDASICVLSAAPEKTSRQLGVYSVRRDDPAAVLRAMLHSAAYISGGGSLLQDTTSRRSLYYYSALMLLGKLITGKLIVFANGIGELHHRHMAASALRSADYISVRDPSSLKLIEAMGISCGKACLTADPALLLRPTEDSEEAKRLLIQCGVGTSSFFAVSLRDCAYKVNLSAVKAFAADNSAIPLFISMEDSYDLKLCRRAASLCGGAHLSPKSYSSLVSVLQHADFAVGMRLHFLIAAAAAHIPFGALSYDCKTDAFMSYVHSDAVIPASRITYDSLTQLSERMTAVDTEKLIVSARNDASALANTLFAAKPIIAQLSAERK